MKLRADIGTQYFPKRPEKTSKAHYCDCHQCGTEIHYPMYRVTTRDTGTLFFHARCYEEKEKKRRDALSRGPKAL